jgi:hypothetical protein
VEYLVATAPNDLLIVPARENLGRSVAAHHTSGLIEQADGVLHGVERLPPLAGGGGQLLGGMLALGDVLGSPPQPGDGALRIEDDLATGDDPRPCAVGTVGLQLDLEWLARVAGVWDCRLTPGEVVGRQDARFDELLLRCGRRIRVATEHAPAFLRPAHNVGLGIPFPTADPGDALGLSQIRIPRSQIAMRQEAGKTVAQTPADLLEEPLLLRRPDPWVGALMEPKDPWLACLGAEHHAHLGLNVEALRHLRRQRMPRSRAECHRTTGGHQRSQDIDTLRVHRLSPAQELTGVLRPRALDRNSP